MKVRCEDISTLLEQYLDGVLRPVEETIVTSHLQDCSACRQEVLRERLLRDSLARLPELPLAPGVRQRLLEATRRWNSWPRILHRWHPGANRAGRRRAPDRFWRRRALPAVAALLAAIALLALWFPRERVADREPSYTQAEILAARQQAKYSLVLALHLVSEAERKTVADLIGRQLPRTIRKSLHKAAPPSRGGEG